MSFVKDFSVVFMLVFFGDLYSCLLWSLQDVFNCQ